MNPSLITSIQTEIAGNEHDIYYKNLSHVIISFINPLDDKGNSVGISDDGKSQSVSEASLKNIIQLIRKKNPAIRIGIALGGGGAASMLQRYVAIFSAPNGLEIFSNTCISFIKRVEADFIDVDLEYQFLDLNGYNPFVQKLFTTAKNNNINQTLTLEYKYDDGGIVTKVNKVSAATFASCDLLNIMSYDYNDNYSPTKSKLNDKNHSPVAIAKRDIDFFLTKVNADKLVLGLPLYGKSAYAKDPIAEYIDIDINKLDENGYIVGKKGSYFFNTKTMISNKLDYASQKQICGVMFWSIRSDRMSDYNNSVLKYVVENQK
jgi:GH18 family chitinase